MAKIWYNPAIQGICGKIGDWVYRRMRDGSMRVSRKQDFSKRKLSQKQKEHHERFRRAAAYAREAAKSQPLYAQAGKETGLCPYNAAMADWFHPPVIQTVEWEADRLLVWATDNIMVAGVRVVVLGEKGEVLEEGEARRSDGKGNEWWEYSPEAKGRIAVEARDLAGNVTKKEIGEWEMVNREWEMGNREVDGERSVFSIQYSVFSVQ